jgi:hypothetical protein
MLFPPSCSTPQVTGGTMARRPAKSKYRQKQQELERNRQRRGGVAIQQLMTNQAQGTILGLDPGRRYTLTARAVPAVEVRNRFNFLLNLPDTCQEAADKIVKELDEMGDGTRLHRFIFPIMCRVFFNSTILIFTLSLDSQADERRKGKGKKGKKTQRSMRSRLAECNGWLELANTGNLLRRKFANRHLAIY